jgi:quinol monooxygenase YgiN
MAAVVIRHRVKDFDAWKQVYEEHGVARKENGCTGDSIMRDEADPNEVLVTTYWPASPNVHAFVDDPSLKDAMGRAGVIGAPRIEFYEDAAR